MPAKRRPVEFATSPLILFSLFILVFGAIFPAASSASATPVVPDEDEGRLVFPGSGPPGYQPGELLVKFRGGPADAYVSRLRDWLGLDEMLEGFELDNGDFIQRLRLKADVSVEKAIQALRSLQGVIYAEPNYLAHPAYAPSDPAYPSDQWGLNNTGQSIQGTVGIPDCDIDAPEAWDLERGQSNPVTVAVIDTGIDLGHPDLDGKIEPGYNWAGISQTRYYYYDFNASKQYTTAWYFGYSPGTQLLAQAITGTGQALSHVGVFLQKTGSPSQSISVSLRSSLDGPNLSSLTIQPSEMGSWGGEIYRALSAPVTLSAGGTYYLIFQTANNDPANCYYLYHNLGDGSAGGTDKTDPYREGSEYRWTGAAWQNYPYDDFYFRTNPNASPHDDNGHGTHVAGIIGAEEGNGLGGVGASFGARLMPLKTLNCAGGGTYADIISAIRYAADNGAKVINMSLSGSSYSSALQDGVNYAHDRGVAVCAAAGNKGDNSIMYPAGCDNVIGVGATGNQDEIASWSNHNQYVDLSAPGISVYSTMPTYPAALNSGGISQYYDYLSGTSMATPMVSGLAALVRSKEPRYGVDQVQRVMENNANDLGAPGRDEYFGWGRLNAYQTLNNMPPFPEIYTISMASGNAGQSLAVLGSGFGSSRGGSYVSFGGTPAATYDSWSDGRIDCRVPAGVSGQVQVTVTTSVGTSNGRSFTVIPHIESLSVSSAAPTQTIGIYGSAFGPSRGNSYVSFSGTPAVAYDSWSDSYIACRVPKGLLGEVQLMVVTEGASSNSLPFTVELPLPETWYLAEGCTAGDFETWVLVQNPGDEAVDIDMRFQTDKGEVQGPKESIAPHSRRSYNLGGYVVSYNVSTIVIPSGGEIICERAEYGNNRAWGHDSVGATSPSTTWYLAEGCTAGDFETWVLVQNPGDAAVDIDMRFQTDKRELQGPKESIAPRSRRSYKVNDYVKSYNVSTKVTSSGAGVICERAEYGNNRAWGHDSVGATSPSTTWYLAEGCTAGEFETWVLVQNPGDAAVDIDMRFQTDKGEVQGPKESLAPRSRRSYKVNNYVTSYDVSTKVTSSGAGVICERAEYGNNRAWGHDSVGATSPSTTWYLAEGCTAGGFETWVLVQNPGPSSASIDLFYQTASGELRGPHLDLPPMQRTSVNVGNNVTTSDVSTMVKSDVPIVVERAMYWGNRAGGSDSIGYSPDSGS